MLGRAVRQCKTLGRAADDRRPQSFQGGPEFGILDLGDPALEPASLRGLERPRRRGQAPRRRCRRRLPQGKPGDGAITEEGVDALEEHRLAVLDLERAGRGDAQMERAVATLAAREAELLGADGAGDVLADDRRPLGDELRFGEAMLAEHGAGDAWHLGRKRAQPASPLVCHRPSLLAPLRLPCHGRGLHRRRRMPRSVRTATAVAPAAEPKAAAGLSDRVLAWYDRHRRDLPWRAQPGERPDPYRVWLSEVMLQQTTVATVGAYFDRFVARWPDLRVLAAASLDEVLHAWQGLGYYARARHLHACARAVVERHDGRFPADEAALRALPGIGDYTAAAVAAIAFDIPATPLDGNIERVMARLFAHGEALPEAKPALRRLAATLTPARRPGDYAQAVMDLGATICTPKKPRCILCPWREACRGRQLGVAEQLPAQRPRPPKPVRRGVAFWALRPDGAVLLRRRPEKGLLGGMMEVPSTPWREAPWSAAEAMAAAPLRAKWRLLAGVVRHSFTHFHLELAVLASDVREGCTGGGEWVGVDALGQQALPTLIKKVVAHARGGPRRPAP